MSTEQSVSANAAKKEYETMKRRVIWSFVFTVPLFYISMGKMLGWPLPGYFLGMENSMIYAFTQFFTFDSGRIYQFQILPCRI